jgi:hypothetical protein
VNRFISSLSLVLLISAVFCLGLYFAFHRMDTAKKTWPSIPGKMIESEIIRTTKAYLQTPSVNRGIGDDTYYRKYPVWALQVTFSYRIGDQEYNGHQATSTNQVDRIDEYPNGPSQEMVNWSHQLQKGAFVEVHYDPTNPVESYVLYAESRNRWLLITGSVLLILGLAVVAAPRIFQ